MGRHGRNGANNGAAQALLVAVLNGGGRPFVASFAGVRAGIEALVKYGRHPATRRRLSVTLRNRQNSNSCEAPVASGSLPRSATGEVVSHDCSGLLDLHLVGPPVNHVLLPLVKIESVGFVRIDDRHSEL